MRFRLRVCGLAALGALAASTTGCLGFHQGALPNEPKGQYADLEGTRVRFADSAAQGPDERRKPAAVFIHGFAASMDTWVPVTPAVRKSHRVITLDLKGFGWTDRPEGDYSPDAQARLVLALMDRLEVPNAAVVAHSWGSSVALALALKAPTRVRRLAMYDAWVYEEQLPVFFHWARAGGLGEAMFASYYRERAEDRLALAFFDKSYITEALVENVNEALDRPGAVAAALAAVRGQRYADVQERYKKVTQKTLLLWGRDDVVTRLSYGERLAHELPNASMVVYPRCGHFPMIEALSASNRDLARFLDEELTSGSKDEPGPSTPGPQTNSPSGAAF